MQEHMGIFQILAFLSMTYCINLVNGMLRTSARGFPARVDLVDSRPCSALELLEGLVSRDTHRDVCAVQDLAQAYQGGDEAVAMVIAQSAAEQQAMAELRRLLQAAKDMGS